MAALVSVFAIVVLSLLITRFAVLVLVVTGLSRESARFQARSALTGSGFTTSESEAVVDHPVRRRAIMRLMLIGNAGIVTVVASLVLSFRGGSGDERLVRAAVLVAGLALLWWLSRRDWVDRRLTALMARFLRSRGLDARDYARLLDLSGDYAVAELKVQPGDWVAGRTLADLRLRDEGLVVLGIHRDGGYVGVPDPHARVEDGDTLVLYGRTGRVAELDDRRRGASGDRAHEQARAEQRRVAGEEAARAGADGHERALGAAARDRFCA